MANPQIENGYTKISNELLEKIISSGLNGTEFAIIFFIIRKTYGYNKKQDEISLSQFLSSIPRTKQTICTALNNLKLVKIIRLVKKGNSKICSNLWVLNKDYDSWQLVRKSRLVKFSSTTSQVFHTQLVKKTRHTKENTKENTKEREILKNPLFYQVWQDYKEMRIKIKKPMTPRAEDMALKFLEKENVETAIKILEQSIFNSWQGLFPLKQNIVTQTEDQKLEQLAKEMVAKYGANDASIKFEIKYGRDAYSKFRHTLFEGN